MILMFGGMFGIGAWMEQQQAQGGANPVMGLWMMLALYVVMTLGLIVISAIFQAIFLFAFPLIVDREMTGWEAVTTSVRAAFANLGGVLAIVFIELFFVLIGVLFCIIGAYFVLPISFAMTAVAYRQVFPAADPFADYEPDPELPAPVVVSKDTGVQSLEPRSTGVKDHSVGSNDQQV
jgi:hypothetical protein